jgi:hypothetical protein
VSAQAKETAKDVAPTTTKARHDWRGVMAQLRLSTHDLDNVSMLLPQTA